jgi:large subunit ribosomal protein L24e
LPPRPAASAHPPPLPPSSIAQVSSLHHQRKKPARLSWTLASRRAHKKLNTDASTKKRARRVVKVQRGYVGAEKIEEVRKKNASTRATAPISAQKNGSGGLVQAAIAEAKLKQKAAQAARKAAGVAAGAGKGKGAPAAAKHAGKGR